MDFDWNGVFLFCVAGGSSDSGETCHHVGARYLRTCLPDIGCAEDGDPCVEFEGGLSLCLKDARCVPRRISLQVSRVPFLYSASRGRTAGVDGCVGQPAYCPSLRSEVSRCGLDGSDSGGWALAYVALPDDGAGT